MYATKGSNQSPLKREFEKGRHAYGKLISILRTEKKSGYFREQISVGPQCFFLRLNAAVVQQLLYVALI